MTLNDLKNELSALGFERDIAIDKALTFCVRRALSTIYTERGVYNSISIEHRPVMPTLVCKSFTHTPGKTESFNLKGRAFSFSVSGSGFFAIEENGVRTEHEFSSALYLWRIFISNEATLSFFGDFAFEVINLSVFEYIRSKDENELFAYGEPFEYDMRQLTDDFNSFTSMPTDENGREISGILMRSSMLIIPWGYRGRINLVYKAAPPQVSEDTPDEEIPISRETEHLVPLLSAAYYWADDAPDKAEYYLALYKDAMKMAKEFNTRALGSGYNNVTRWA